MQSVYHFEWLLRAAPRELWPFVSDTQRLNEALGMPPITYTERYTQDGHHRRVGQMTLHGIDIAWDEKLYNWVVGREWSTERRYESGPLLTLRSTPRMETVDGGTRLTHTLEFQPRSLLWTPVARFELGVRLRRNLDAVYRQIDDYLAGKQERAWNLRKPQISDAAREWMGGLHTHLTQVDGFDSAIVRRLLDMIYEEDDRTVDRLRPFELADEWGADRVTVLRLCLQATRRGLLSLHWDVLCPHCRKEKVRLPNLADLQAAAHCEACEVSIATDRERAVELVFSVNPTIRAIDVNEYCVGGPGVTPHVVIQQRIPAGESFRVSFHVEPGTYRIRGPGIAKPSLVHARPGIGGASDDGGPGEKAAPARFEVADGTVTPRETELACTNLELIFENRDGEERAVLLERADWFDHAVTIGRAMALQEFRDLFPKQTPPPSVQVEVERYGIVIARVDGLEEALVSRDEDEGELTRRDLDVTLRETVRSGRGAVAASADGRLLGVFADLNQAVKVAARLLVAVVRFGAERRLRGLTAAAGLHAGPCVVHGGQASVDTDGAPVRRADELATAARAAELVIASELRDEKVVAAALEREGIYPARADAPAPPDGAVRLRVPVPEPDDATETDLRADDVRAEIAKALAEVATEAGDGGPDPERSTEREVAAVASSSASIGPERDGAVDPSTLQLGRELGRGTAGVVHEATDADGRRYAVKVVKAPALSEAYARFEREVRTLRTLTRLPGIVAIRGSGRRGEDEVLIAMDYIDGVSLGQRLEEGGPVGVTEAARLAARIARALERAHGLGILHRDVKPANVIIDAERGEPWLVDFGLAKLLHDPGITAPNAVVGTMPFLAPEMFSGRGLVDGRADLYALGVVFFQAVTGFVPFSANNINDLMFKIIDEPPPAISPHAEVDATLDALVAKALAKRPDDRYASAKEMAEDLERVAADDAPLIALGLAAPGEGRRWWRPTGM